MTLATPILPGAIERIRDHHARYRQLLAATLERSRDADVDELLRLATRTAGWAWLQHAGIHVSPALEAAIATVATARLAGPAWHPRDAANAGRRPRVLHVLSQAYPTGGHTRWSERIIRADRARRHDVLLTAQGQLPVPPWLRDAAEASGGRLHAIPAGTSVARAHAVARLARDADLVLANLHPNDAPAVAALGDRRSRPPVVTLDHADHACWLGIGATDLLADFRRSGQALSFRRRGADPDRSAVLPLPVDVPERPVHADPRRARMREALGIGAGELVLLSAGSAWKFDPQGLRGEPSYPEILAPLVAADHRLRLFVLGPQPIGPWAEAARLTGGRMRALGTRTDYADHWLAADVYLDPFPMGSLYSLLEPAAAGVAAVSLAQWPDEAAVLRADAPGLDGVRPVATDPVEYANLVRSLLDDEAGRRDLGARLREQVGREHAGDGWLATWERLVEAAPLARQRALDAPLELDPSLDEPSTGLLSQGLAGVPERVPALPDRVTVHVPLAPRG